MPKLEPIEFTIGIDEFNSFILPETAWDVSSTQFKEAVTAFYVEQFAPVGGTVTVNFDHQSIHVTWVPTRITDNPFEYAISLLQAGELRKAVPLLKTFLTSNRDDAKVLYNLGMALSDLGDLEEAIQHLSRLVTLDPRNVNGLVALGVAQQRIGDSNKALNSLREAAALAPNNHYAHRNLGAVLDDLGQHSAAEPHLRTAVRLQPQDQAAVFGLARCLDNLGGKDQLQEADKLYITVIDQNPYTEIAELARTARSKIAQKNFHDKSVSGARPDAIFYCLGALERFAKMSPAEVQGISFEIAMLGRSGLDINDSTPKYKLRSLQGDFSGLHLVCIMYVGFKQIAPELDGGIDLAREFETAQQLFSAKDGTA